MFSFRCTTFSGYLVVTFFAVAHAQDITSRNPLPRGPDATSRADIKLLSVQVQSQPTSFQPDATALSALLTAARGANATSFNASPRGLGSEFQNSIAHTDVMPSEVLGWPPKNASLAPTPSPINDQPGANGAADYKPRPPPDPIQVPDDSSSLGPPYDIVTSADGYSTFMPRNNSINGSAFELFWADSMRNPQVLGARLPQGTYAVQPSQAPAGIGGTYHLSLDCLGRQLSFVLDFQGSALVFMDGSKGGVAYKNCSRLTVKGVTLSYPPSQFQHTQGVVVDVGSPPIRTVTVQAHEGYPLHIWADAKMCAAYTEGTQVIRTNTSDIIPSSVEQLDGGHYRLITSYDLYNIQPGDLLACHAGVGSHGMFWQRCADCLMTDTIFCNPTGHWIAEVACRNMTYSGNHLAPYPSTLGSAQLLPLISSVGDGINVRGPRSGPTIVGNSMRGMGGDGVSIASVVYAILEVDGGNSTISVACSGATCSGIRPGDSVSAGMSPSEPLEGSAKVVGVTSWGLSPRNGSAVGAAELPDALLRLLLASWPASWTGTEASPAVLLVAPATKAAAAQIGRNTIANNRGSGVIVQVPRAVVANNMITSPKYWGIQALPSIEGGGSGAFTKDLVVTNNTIDAVFGGVLVGCLAAAGKLPCPARGHANVTISNNLIGNAASLPLLVTSARGVSIAGNVFRSVLCYPWVLYNGFPWLPHFWQATGFVAEADNVTFQKNIIDTSAHCAYGNTQNPFEVLFGTVTNLTIF